MITYHLLKQKIARLKQLVSVVESSGAQAMSLHRAIRNLESSIREFPKAKETDVIHKDVAEEAQQAHAVLQRFLQNLSMACYHFAERGKRDEFNNCEVRLTRAVRIWQTENVGFNLMPEETKPQPDQKGKGIKSLFKKKAAK